MSELFLTLLNMSITASWLIAAVLLLRLLLKKAPKWITVLLWGAAAVRLICPLTMESSVSLVPSAETIPLDIGMAPSPTIHSGITVVNSVVNPILSQSAAPTVEASVNPMQIIIAVGWNLWLLGMAGMLVYGAVTTLRLHRRVASAVLLRDRIYQSEHTASPFVLGIVRPRIYIPFGLDGGSLTHVIAHENAHIRRFDHLWKPLGFLILSIHWFNPLVWLSYILLCRDIEAACDEKVIHTLSDEERANYSEALLRCSVPRRMIAACPLAFGEVSVKNRVKGILNYKKPAFWIIAAAILACGVTAACFLTNPKTTVYTEWRPLEELYENYTPRQAEKDGCVVLDGQELISGERIWNEFVNKTNSKEPAAVRVYQNYSDQSAYYVKELRYDGSVFRLRFYDWTGDTHELFLFEEEYKYLVRSFYEFRGTTSEYFLLADSMNVTAEGHFSSMVSSVYRPEYDIYNHCHVIYRDDVTDHPMLEDQWYLMKSYYGTAYGDIDGDRREETLYLGMGMTSGLFTFTLTAAEGGEVEYTNIFCTEFYHLSFTEKDGKVKVRAVTQGESPETHLFDISIKNGMICLSENGILIKPSGRIIAEPQETEPAEPESPFDRTDFTGLIQDWNLMSPRDGYWGTLTIDSVDIVSPDDTETVESKKLTEEDRVNGYYILNRNTRYPTFLLIPEGSEFRFFDRTGIFGDKNDSRYSTEDGWVTTADAEVFTTYLKTYRKADLPAELADESLPPILFGFTEQDGKLFISELFAE